MKNNNINNDKVKEAWDNWSDNYYTDTISDVELIKKMPHKVFPTKVWEWLNSYYPSFKGLKICVPSSGDNSAVFAFYLLGADVTSCDISNRQIENAKRIADSNGWDIDFRVLDSMDLFGIESEAYDLVYTSNGVHVWISDLQVMYGGFNRILKTGGRYVFFETHPFNRPFDDSSNELKIIKPYWRIRTDGDIPNYHWRVQDFINSLIASEFNINGINEMFAEKDNISASWWKISEWDQKADFSINPYAALPAWIAFSTIK